MKTLDGARAYVEAGYEVKNKKGATAAAYNLRHKKQVKEYIDGLFEKVRKRNELDCDKVIELLGAIAFTSPADLGEIEEEENGEQKIRWKSFEELDEDTKRAIAIIKNTRGAVEIETQDRMKAIAKLMKHLGIEKNGEGGVVIKGEEAI